MNLWCSGISYESMVQWHILFLDSVMTVWSSGILLTKPSLFCDRGHMHAWSCQIFQNSSAPLCLLSRAHTHTGLWLLLTSRVDEIMCLLESGFTAILAQYFRTPAMTPGIQYSRACDCSEYHYTPSLSNSAFCVSSVDLVLTHLHACVTHTSYQTACTHSIVCVCAGIDAHIHVCTIYYSTIALLPYSPNLYSETPHEFSCCTLWTEQRACKEVRHVESHVTLIWLNRSLCCLLLMLGNWCITTNQLHIMWPVSVVILRIIW